MTNVDPITLQVIGGALHTIAKEMGHVLYRMSYSSIIRESEDLGAGLFNRDFNTLCESDSTPMHIGSIPGYLRGVERTMHGDWKPGDVVLHNHPYHGASHVPDICCIAPVFFEGELVGFSANTAHHVDLGAASPGIVIDIPDVYAEGMLFSGIKLYEEGKLNRALWQHIQTNTRVPRDVSGDIEAQVASAELGVRRFGELYETYGKETIDAATAELMDYSERMLRRRIREIPDGDYRAEGFLDDDGVDRETRLPVKVTVRIRGDSAVVDTTGSSPQVPTAYNVPFEGSTKVTCYFAFRALLLDTYTTSEYIPQNEGSVPPDRGDLARGLDLQPDLSGGLPVALLPVPAPGRPDRRGTGAGDPRQGDRRLRCHPFRLRLFRRAARRRLLDPGRDQRIGLWRAPGLRRAGFDRRADAQHPQQPDRGPRHASAADLRSLRAP